MSNFFYIGLGYLLGMGVLGYAALLAWIQERKPRGLWPAWLANLLTGIHFALGISGGFVPVIFRHQFRDPGNRVGPFLFAFIGLLTIGIALLVSRDWNRRFGSHATKQTD